MLSGIFNFSDSTSSNSTSMEKTKKSKNKEDKVSKVKDVKNLLVIVRKFFIGFRTHISSIN